jgi:hypothetical protein
MQFELVETFAAMPAHTGDRDGLAARRYNEIEDVRLKSLQSVRASRSAAVDRCESRSAENGRPLALLFRWLATVEDDSEPEELPPVAANPAVHGISIKARSRELRSARDAMLAGGDYGEGVAALILRQLWHDRTLAGGESVGGLVVINC